MTDLEGVCSGGVTASLEPELAGGANVLLLGPAISSAVDEGCSELLCARATGCENVLFVTLSQSPDERLATLRMAHDEAPDKLGVVDVGDVTRSAAATDGGSMNDPALPFSVETVSSPGDLTGLGIKITEYLDEWHDDGNRVSVCFHSLTTLLQYVDLKEAFRFLHVMGGRFHTVEAVAHFHMDPGAHDERTLNTLKALFDVVLAIDEDGDWSVQSR